MWKELTHEEICPTEARSSCANTSSRVIEASYSVRLEFYLLEQQRRRYKCVHRGWQPHKLGWLLLLLLLLLLLRIAQKHSRTVLVNLSTRCQLASQAALPLWPTSSQRVKLLVVSFPDRFLSKEQ